MTSRFNRPFISEPEIIGHFSVDSDRKYLANFSKLYYYNPPQLKKVYFNLNRGTEFLSSDFYKKWLSPELRSSDSNTDGTISHLLEWIKLNNTKILASDPDKWIEPHFVCSCGLLTTLLCTSQIESKGWIICAAKWKGTIYLCRFKTPEEEIEVPRQLLSYSMRFTQYVLSDHPDKVPDPYKPIVKNEDFRCVIKRRFGNHEILFSAGIDAVCSKTILDDPLPLKELKFVELRTKKFIANETEDEYFRKFVLVYWWALSFVVGIEKTLCGYRDCDGIVRNLESYSRDRLSEMSKNFWKPQSCLDYFQSVLYRLSKSVVDECDTTIYKLEKLPYKDFTITKLSPTSELWSKYAFMPSSFSSKRG